MKSGKPFIHDDFLLLNKEARVLYHEHAVKMPIIDYHSHLPPQQVADDKRWHDIAELWFAEDHYKWRALRANGVDENFITGKAAGREKFQQFAASMRYFIRNPLFDWSHLELARYFDIYDLLNEDSAQSIWERAIERMSEPWFSARGLMQKSRVRLVCTTDDPIDTLEHHIRFAREKGAAVQMLPTWRPERALYIERTSFWNDWLDKLGMAAGISINTFDDCMEALQKRHDFFAAAGCRLSDYGVDTLHAEPYTMTEIRGIFVRVRKGGNVTDHEIRKFRSALMYEFGRMDAASDWTWQIHYGPLRNNCSRLFKQFGPDAGCDSMADLSIAHAMAKLFDRLDEEDCLPRTIFYTLNPSNNELICAMLGNFQRGPLAGKMQFGSGWWFNDQRDGMLRQMETLSQLGLLSRFVGMLTDSRSFVSFARHEYFRRILCNMLGADMAEGRIPYDIGLIGSMVRDICYRNAAAYFGFNLPAE